MAISKFVSIIGKELTRIENYNLIKRDEVQMLIDHAVKCLEMAEVKEGYDYILKNITVSKRMKTTAGTCQVIAKNIYEITLAHNNYEEFGFDSMLKTLSHEIAHMVEHLKYGRMSHSETFKRICVQLGGHMNKKLAGYRYAEAATEDYCKKKVVSKKYIYSCPCGAKIERVRKLSDQMLKFGRCVDCRTRAMDMKLIIL